MSITSVFFVGNPGVGKSTLLNSLGGNFSNGLSYIEGLTKTVSSVTVNCEGRSLRLIDVPGVMGSDKGETVLGNLRMLQDALNSSGSSVLFFVVTPRNGRVAPDDFAVMKTLLMNLKRGPMVGLIITQVKRRQMAALYNDEFYSNFLEVLQAVDADTTFFEQHRWLILEEHEEDFDDDDRRAIRDYVFSFTPETVKVQSLIASIFQRILDFSKGISGVLDNA